MLTCSNCHHPGTHAEVVPAEGGYPSRCTQCPRCQAEAQAYDSGHAPT